MIPASDVAARFDKISEVYDETREPLTPGAVDRVVAFLAKEGAETLLEVGVGTGRIAAPLVERNVDIVGVDLSRKMLERAKMKGVAKLVMADANQLPFVDGSFDAVLMAHVLHLLENPGGTVEKVARMARKELVIIFRRRDGLPHGFDGDRREIWQAFRQAAEEAGYPLPSPSDGYVSRFRREAEFLEGFPPDEVIVVQDLDVVTTLGERLTVFEKRAYGFPMYIPDEVFQKVVARLRATVDLTKEVRYRRVEQLGVWHRERLMQMERTWNGRPPSSVPK